MMWPLIRQISKVGIATESAPAAHDLADAGRIQDEILRILGRALTIREVDAGSCNGCELEIHAMNNAIYNCERFGIHFTASPRFADMLLVTVPVTHNMEIALRRTYQATPSPKLVLAVGDCGCNGGIFGESYASLGGVSKVLSVDLEIPGCPPEPIVILEGILTAVRYRLKKRAD